MVSTQLTFDQSPEDINAYNDTIELARQDLDWTLAIWLTILVSGIVTIVYALYLIYKSSKI